MFPGPPKPERGCKKRPKTGPRVQKMERPFIDKGFAWETDFYPVRVLGGSVLDL